MRLSQEIFKCQRRQVFTVRRKEGLEGGSFTLSLRFSLIEDWRQF